MIYHTNKHDSSLYCGGVMRYFSIHIPELQYYETNPSQQLVNAMKDDGISLYEIAVQQQYLYSLTKVVPEDLIEYLDSNRRSIKTVKYNIKHNVIMMDDMSIEGDIDVFKGIVALLHHPMNIIEENHSDVQRVYKYYTLNTLT